MISIDSPTIFLPGTLCDERIWMPCWQHLSIRERYYVPLQWANSKAEMLALCCDRIDRATHPVHLVGYSMGGYIALLAALAQVKSQRVKSLTLIGYNPAGLSSIEQAQRQTTLNALKRGNARFSDEYLKRFFTDAERQQPALVQPVLDMANDLGAATLKAQFIATSEREDLTNALLSLSIPIQLICSEHDSIADANAIATLAKRPHVKLCMLTNTAHMMPLTQPDNIAALIADMD
ncbi:alpha/beta fold hydrolase [Alteromonas oceanisediminis]|uniref:alpha/beta fold hydrolase n=1 Tax=Alteromonas oceanisediminis TaxID=2836180 RepID=UPI001BDAB691|nr:alpha/beta hydrolase [Alteromonas oceanisediminis]MBT0586898.1 alpha/beta hydrolase [Alteromonas oceanisediminis]